MAQTTPPPTRSCSETQSTDSVATKPSRLRIPAILLAIAGLIWLWIATVDPDSRAELWRSFRVKQFAINLGATYLTLIALYVLFGAGDKRLRIFRVTLLTFMTGLALAVVEIPAVVFKTNFELKFGTTQNSGRSHWVPLGGNANKPDPELLHIHWPHTSFKGSIAGNLDHLGLPAMELHDIDMSYDQHGFRNDRDFEQADIAVIGDSFVEAALTPLNHTTVKRLQETLGETVVNLGQSAYGPQQELVALKRYALPLSPKIVLWFLFGGNDLNDIDGYTWQKEHLNELQAPRPLRIRLFTRNALLAISKWTTPARTAPSLEALQRSGLFTLANGSQERVYFGLGTPLWKPHQMEKLTAILDEANKSCVSADARFILVYVPRKFRVYRDHTQFDSEAIASSWTINDLPNVLASFCAKKNIDFVDTTPALSATVARGEHVYFVDDVHWNSKGNEIAALAITDFLNQRPTSP